MLRIERSPEVRNETAGTLANSLSKSGSLKDCTGREVANNPVDASFSLCSKVALEQQEINKKVQMACPFLSPPPSPPADSAVGPTWPMSVLGLLGDVHQHAVPVQLLCQAVRQQHLAAFFSSGTRAGGTEMCDF